MNSNYNPEKKFIATYGSLRKDEYNYKSFLRYFPTGFKYLFTTQISGYLLYDLGAYPGVLLSSDSDKKLMIDVMECSNECFQNINIMEFNANYTSKEIEVEGIKCTIYIYKGRVDSKHRIEHGDWSKYLKLKAEVSAIMN